MRIYRFLDKWIVARRICGFVDIFEYVNLRILCHK